MSSKVWAPTPGFFGLDAVRTVRICPLAVERERPGDLERGPDQNRLPDDRSPESAGPITSKVSVCWEFRWISLKLFGAMNGFWKIGGVGMGADRTPFQRFDPGEDLARMGVGPVPRLAEERYRLNWPKTLMMLHLDGDGPASRTDGTDPEPSLPDRSRRG